MSGRSLLSVLLILSTAACVDRVFIEVGNVTEFAVVIDGRISDQPGPYTIKINKAFDVESKSSPRIPLSAKHIVLSDDYGTSEELTLIDDGIYQTSPTGIRGTIGRAYKIRIELLDGRIYESKPDTLLAPGKLDSVYFNFKKEKTEDFVSAAGSDKYSFDVFINSSPGENKDYRFMWRFEGTFKADTHPELLDPDKGSCERLDDGYTCNYLPICSGLRNVGTNRSPRYDRVKPCECCTCWYNLYNSAPVLSDDQLSRDGHFTGIQVYNVPLNRWMFMYKVHVEVSQISLSQQAYDFWNAIKDQKDAIGSLFQPITGKIPGSFVQISGSPTPISGLFYATSITSKSLYITRDDVPNPSIIPTTDPPYTYPCFQLFPHSTTTKPSFWQD